MKNVIYLITNTTNGKRYIGSTKDLSMRKGAHAYKLKNNIHKNRGLAADFQLGHKFIYTVLESVSQESLTKIEKVWIRFLKPEYNVYNTNKKRASRSK